MNAERAKGRLRVKAHRERLRAQGLRPIQIWVPDVNAPGFEEEARRQSLLIAKAPDEQEIMDFIESLSTIEDDD
jgi:hypothetical protein